MTGENFRAVIGWFQARPRAKKVLWLVSKGTVAAVYLCYLVLLAACLWLRAWYVLLGEIIVPAVAFLLGTLLRRLINRPRPYEEFGFEPLFPKDTKGQSFPSRHCFSAAAIAVCSSYVAPVLCAVVTASGAAVAVCRVLTGVHRISDVIAGLAFGALIAYGGAMLYFRTLMWAAIMGFL